MAKNVNAFEGKARSNPNELMPGGWFEQRKIDNGFEAVAYIETIEVKDSEITENVNNTYPLWRSKQALLSSVSKYMPLGVFVVWHNPSCTKFAVENFRNKEFRIFDEQGYKNFVTMIHKFVPRY